MHSRKAAPMFIPTNTVRKRLLCFLIQVRCSHPYVLANWLRENDLIVLTSLLDY